MPTPTPRAAAATDTIGTTPPRSPATPKFLTAADLHALNRYYEVTEPLISVYHRMFGPQRDSGEASQTSSGTEGEGSVLGSVHTAASADFMAQPQPAPIKPQPPLMAEHDRQRREERQQALKEPQRTRFLIRCLQLDPQGASEQMLRHIKPVLGEAHEGRDQRQTGATKGTEERGETAAVSTKHAHKTERIAAVTEPRFFTQEMVTSLLAFRQHQGAINSIPTLLSVVRTFSRSLVGNGHVFMLAGTCCR
jgi:hypothetical protein